MSEVLLAALILGAVGDAITTQQVLKLGGRELNPLMRDAINGFGLWPSMVVAKGALVAAMLYFKPDELVWWAVIGWQGVLVANNLIVIRRLR